MLNYQEIKKTKVLPFLTQVYLLFNIFNYEVLFDTYLESVVVGTL